ncbi:MAG: TIGR02147 family protein [Bdellovibrionota bacterium]
MNTHIDPRVWLQSEFSKRRAKNPHYSLRMLAKKLDIPSGRLSEILSGKRRVTRQLAIQIADKLSLDPELRSKLITSTTAFKSDNLQEPSFEQISLDSFHVIADWYHFAILSLIELKNFQNDAKWISRRLGISIVDTNTALERLFRLGLVKEKNNKLTQTHKNISTTHDIQSIALRHSHKQSLENAITALEEVSIEKRDITSMTMAIDSSKIPQAKEMIKKFRRQLCAFLESGTKKDEVYDLNVQLLPITKRVSND